MLNETQIERYSRQIILPEIGGRGQVALLSATVVIYGSNELATTAALYLAGAGLGHLHVSPPTAAAIADVNPDCQITSGVFDDEETAADIWRTAAQRGAVVVLCAGAGSDVCSGVYAVAVRTRLPLCVGDVSGARGWMSVRAGSEPAVPCHACLVRSFGATCGNAAEPLADVVAALVGTQLAAAAITLLLGLEPRSRTRVVMFDALAGEVREAVVAKDPLCPVCGDAA